MYKGYVQMFVTHRIKYDEHLRKIVTTIHESRKMKTNPRAMQVCEQEIRGHS